MVLPDKALSSAFVVAVVLVVEIVGAQQTRLPTSTVAWEQSQSVSVRLSIKGHELAAESVAAECFVEGPLPSGVRSRRTWQIARDKQQHLYFPDDFHRLVVPGTYQWGCSVGDRTIANGRFEYLDANHARVIQ
jgi:hypothetical protein